MTTHPSYIRVTPFFCSVPNHLNPLGLRLQELIGSLIETSGQILVIGELMSGGLLLSASYLRHHSLRGSA